MSASDLVARLSAAGIDPSLLADVARELFRAEMDREAIEARRAHDRERQARRRNVMSRDVTGHSVTPCDSADTPPSLDKETLPPTPPIKEINLTPRVGDAPARERSALARKAGGFGPPEGVSLDAWNAFANQRRKPITKLAFDRMCGTLAEGERAGWPPGELVARAAERGWETIYLPTENRNGQRPANDHRNGQPENPWLVGLRQAEAREAR